MPSNNSDQRCKHKDAGGKRCRSLRALDHPDFCSYHAGWLTDDEIPAQHKPEDLTPELLGPLGDFRSMAAINYSLGKLILLLASRRISTKEAAAFGYLFQLQFQTVPGVNNEVSKTQINPAANADLLEVLEKTASLVEQ